MATQQCKTCTKSLQKWGYPCRQHEKGKKTPMTQRLNDQWNAKKQFCKQYSRTHPKKQNLLTNT